MKFALQIYVMFLLSSCSVFAQTSDFERTKELAEQGLAYAQYNLGVMYRIGQGVPQNDTEAVKWYRVAAEQGHFKAQNNLALMYSRGEGVPKNDAEAFKWYRMIAGQGDSVGQYNVGIMYAQGVGVSKSYRKAYAWASMAAAQGDNDAKEAMNLFADVMTRADLSRAQALATKCFESNYKDCD